MTKELFAELKSAGYPVRKDQFAEHIPTLSELIEACGDVRMTLFNLSDGRWIVGGLPDVSAEPVSVTGSTPEEAVANLYLALKRTV